MRRSLALLPALVLSVVVGAAACGSDGSSTTTGTSTTGSGGGGTGGGGSSGGPPLGGQACDPLVPTQCGFPFPSNVYLEDDPSTPTGKHVAFIRAALPVVPLTGHIKPETWADSDGFSPGQAPLTDLPGATTKGLPTQDTIELSVTADSPTILMEADTGELVPHFAELDMSEGSSDEDRTFMIRPVVRLKDATRYIVAIRHVVDKDDKPIEPSPVFKALRDDTASDDPSVAPRRDLYKDIFGKLEKAGIKKDDLQIAWDYSTASRENNTRVMLHMRDDALMKVGDEGPEYEIVSMEDNPNEFIRRRILAKMKVPLYLDQPGPGGKFVLDDKGLPQQNGMAEYEVLIHIPNAATNGTACPPLQNGHGLLGSKNEGRNGYLAQIADKNCYVAFAVDLVGMAEEDYDTVVDAISGDIGKFRGLVDRQHQGILNSLLAMRMMRGRFYKDPAVMFNGKSAIDPSKGYYRGDSQGGIFGTTYMALTTDVERGLLGEPGMPYNLLLNRSVDFDPFFEAFRLVYKSSRDIQLALGLTQMLWDRTEPMGYAPYITQNMLPNTPKHDVLLHAAIGDYQVTPLGAHIIARATGAKNLKPVNRSLYGIPEADGPFTGSGLVEFSFGLPDVPKTNTPPTGPDFPEDKDPHDSVRVLDAARNQTDKFLKEGVIAPFCEGKCDPE